MRADINSIFIYFSSLIITLFFLNRCNKSNVSNFYLKVLSILITALPLSLIAGLKSSSVGTDTYNYMMIFHKIYNSSFNDCIIQTDYEVGFVILVKMLSELLGEDDSIIFFAIEYISLIIFIYSLLKLKDKINPCIAFYIYFLVFYHSTLNIVRQGLALSIIVLMIVKILEKKYIQSIIVFFISISIHFSSIVCIMFIFVGLLFRKYKYLHTKRLIYYLILLITMFIFCIGWNYIMSLPIFSSYVDYIGDNHNLGIGVFITGLIYFIFPLLLCKNRIFDNYESEIIFDISLMYIPIAFLGYFVEYASRLNLFPKLALVLFVANLTHNSKNLCNRYFIFCFYTLLFMIEYIKSYILLNETNAYPYLFNI